MLAGLFVNLPTVGQPLPTITPEEAGFSAERLHELEDFLEQSGSSSLMLVYDGKVFFDWGASHQKHLIHSIRKTLLNSLYGIYVEKGVIDTSATLAELGIDDIEPTLTEQEKQARIADLLKSRSGIYHPAAAVSQGMLRGMPEREAHQPGEHYYYNNWDFNTLGHILEMKTGESIYTLFKQHIADPIGMIHYEGAYTSIDLDNDDSPIPDADGFYQNEPSKSDYPAYHFRMSAHDLAKFGTLYLQEGRWDGKQIIPESWIEASTTAYSITNPRINIGYGMLWNVLIPNENRATKSFFHTGAGIHMLGVYPGSKLVMVHRVDTEGGHNFQQNSLYQIIDLVFAAQQK
ncbi:serine hydrolase domain-containing protein [Gracilimonas mengyeensis]|uniref:serine hydrolase domain-containing protein n=1 Tax=Gracilimonas mengyeensis TaxID=1302730 RepID=UPI001C8F29AA|nr:serine hydrolase [Gracilimonas mengyeensis]